ncbi:antitoxin [Leucobacter sp. OH2974_COT-288]|uniref:Antitoxin n=1 Tax=Canibacter oris TaxID=1365628 RepID=A0A840DNP7_9MICO|nr:Rv0909 family putative TA system antitoxin [Canibacter oris]MBB4071169.1 hypothetical protein [Canibacter oris]RRD36752.1 antitoxin [Leucobacter sp. OH2974_COT-288]
MSLENIKQQAEGLIAKGKEALNANQGKVDETLRSEQAEGVSDKVLDGAANLANKVTGGKFADKVAEVRENLDSKIGNE